MKKKHKHYLTFRILRTLKIAGDHESDSNFSVHDIYLNPFNPLTYFLLIIVVPLSILINGLRCSEEILEEIKYLLLNYKKK